MTWLVDRLLTRLAFPSGGRDVPGRNFRLLALLAASVYRTFYSLAVAAMP